ncbi:MAG: hypothetical protein PHP02_09155 [Eubacteriales bacterium]|nr:hypothetical protein [Eubacteriales bacterium]
MNKSRKLMSLLLVLVLALPMVFVTVNALAEEVVEYEYYVKTSGGRLNVWPQPVKKAGSSTLSLKNGTVIPEPSSKTWSTADRRWMVYIGSGWVDNAYVAKREKAAPAPIDPGVEWEIAKLQGTAPNSVINLWGPALNKKGTKPLIAHLPLGYVFEGLRVYKNGWAEVTFITADLEEVTGWVQTKYLVNMTPKAPVVE